MAGSRSEKIGSIFSRVTGLLRAGAMKEVDKPIWYDVYKAFPPKYEPIFKQMVQQKEIPNIFYPEDFIRAKFFKKYRSPGVIDMINPASRSLVARFVEKYQCLEKEAKEGDDVFRATEEALAAEGILIFKKKLEEDDKPAPGYDIKSRLFDDLKEAPLDMEKPT